MIDIGKQKRRFERSKRNIMMSIGNNGMRVFKSDNFDSQGFRDGGLTRWKPKKKSDGRKTLVGKTRKLRGTIGYVVRGREIWFRSLAEYAKVHNEGLRAGRGKGFVMPKRQFIGKSATHDKMNHRSILKIIKSIMG